MKVQSEQGTWNPSSDFHVEAGDNSTVCNCCPWEAEMDRSLELTGQRDEH